MLRIVKHVTEMTGLEEEFVRRAGGRLDTDAYLREVFRENGKIGSVYDSNVTGYDPYPFAPEQRTNDPLLASIIAPTTMAMVDFVTRIVGWKTDARYNALSYEVGSQWDHDSRALRRGAVPDLRQAGAPNAKLRVIIAQNRDDYWGFHMLGLESAQMPVMEDKGASPYGSTPAATVLQPSGQPGGLANDVEANGKH